MKTPTREEIEAALIGHDYERTSDYNWRHKTLGYVGMTTEALAHYASLFGPLFPTTGEPEAKELDFIPIAGTQSVEAYTRFGSYRVGPTLDGKLAWYRNGACEDYCDDMTHGKSLCQTDFNQRVKSCLKP